MPLLSSTQTRPPIVVAVPSAGPGSVAVCDQVRAVDKTRLVERIGELSNVDLLSLSSGVRQVLGLTG